MIQNQKRKEKKKEKEEGGRVGKRGRGKLTISLRSIRRTLEVKVLHHHQYHLIVFIIYSIAPLDIVSQPRYFYILSLLLGAYTLNLSLHPCPPVIVFIIVLTEIIVLMLLIMVQVCTFLLDRRLASAPNTIEVVKYRSHEDCF